MTDPGATRVAVYIDFDNIVISYYDLMHGRGQFHRDREAPATLASKARQATVDLDAVLDYASSYGTVAQVRAYADWSRTEYASYRDQLVGRSVELIQLFPAAAYGKNGADIRLAIDAVEDMFRLPDITHVVIVAGDSDYVPLAQRLKRLNRQVVAVGVAESTARSLVSAVDRFTSYQELPGLDDAAVEEPEPVLPPRATMKKVAAKRAGAKAGAPASEPVPEPVPDPGAAEAVGSPAPVKKATKQSAKLTHAENLERRATNTLRKALRLGQPDDDGWQHGSALKNQMMRIDPTFAEKTLGFSSFTRFLESRSDLVELDKSQQVHRVRLVQGQ